MHSTVFCFSFAEELNCNAMNLENTKAQMRKGVLEFCILSLLSGKEAYASELIQTLKDSKLLVGAFSLHRHRSHLADASQLGTDSTDEE